MRFTKMHGLGNDYLFLDAAREPAILIYPDLPAIVRSVCDRHESLGADGVIVISRPGSAGDKPDAVAMRIYNADGSEGGMCGNGARCACKLAVERGHVTPGPGGVMKLVVLAGESARTLEARVFPNPDLPGEINRVEIDMGTPTLSLAAIPVEESRLGLRADPLHPHEHFVDGHAGVFVNVGNPHFVVFTQHDPDALADRIGPPLECHPAFPARMNIQIARMAGESRIVLRTWERGAGRTRACGTGACAALVAAVITDRADRKAAVSMQGGELEIAWPESTGRVTMTGEAATAFDAVWEEPLESLAAVLAKVVPALRTPRLLLRPHTISDLADLERSMSDFETARYTRTWPHPYPPGESRRFLRRISSSNIAGDSCGWALTLAATGEYIGSMGMMIDKPMMVAEVGYTVMKPFAGRGYCTEALGAVVRDAFERQKLRKLFATYYTTNPASGRVLEKCGFARAGERKKHAVRFGEVLDFFEVDLMNPTHA